MVVIDDFRKQILYQRLNLGYECTFCKKKFYSKREQLHHLQEFHLKPQRKENFECSRCGKVFGHIQIYQLHQQIHALSEPEVKSGANGKDGLQNSGQISQMAKQLSSPSMSSKQKQKLTISKKAVGLTKIKMEDCLRCDECSCIYIDRSDYFKHMRNFHKVNITIPETSISTTTVKPTAPTKPSFGSDSCTKLSVSPKMCKSCCKHCRDSRFPKDACRHQNIPSRNNGIMPRADANELFRFSMQDNIKDRWSKMVSQRLLESKEPQYESVMIKLDPDMMEMEPSYCSNIVDSEEMSHLLSQVEVKIKTEPVDDR